MTSIEFPSLDALLQDKLEARKKLDDYCKQNGFAPLYQWLKDMEFELSDLVVAGVLQYREHNNSKMPVSMELFESPSLTEYGATILGKVPQNRHSLFSSPEDYLYIKNLHELENATLSQKLKSKEERVDDKNKLNKNRFRSAPITKTDILGRERLDGPYCDFPKPKQECRDFAPCCEWCGVSLYKRPKTVIAEYSLCFRCNDFAFSKLSSAVSLRQSLLLKKLESFNLRLRRWEQEKNQLTTDRSLWQLLFDRPNKELEHFLEANPKPKLDFELSFGSQSVKNQIVVILDTSSSCSRQNILNRDNHQCQLCGYDGDDERVGLEVHHIWPRSKGGQDYPTNLVSMCVRCHDNEKRFEHVRVFKTFPSKTSPIWMYDIKPTLLFMKNEEVAENGSWFGPSDVVYMSPD